MRCVVVWQYLIIYAHFDPTHPTSTYDPCMQRSTSSHLFIFALAAQLTPDLTGKWGLWAAFISPWPSTFEHNVKRCSNVIRKGSFSAHAGVLRCGAIPYLYRSFSRPSVGYVVNFSSAAFTFQDHSLIQNLDWVDQAVQINFSNRPRWDNERKNTGHRQARSWW